MLVYGGPSNKVSRKDLPGAAVYFYFVAGFHIERTSILSLKMGTFLKRNQAISDGVYRQHFVRATFIYYLYLVKLFEFSMVLFLDSITECYCYEFKDWEIEAKEEVVRGLRI